MKGLELVDMDLLSQNGACGFTDDGVPIMDEKILYKALIKAHELNLPVALHEEDPLFIKQAGVNMGDVSKKLNYGGKSYAGQEMYWLLFYFDGDDSEINLNTAEPEFDAFRWADFEEAVDGIVEFKKTAYQTAMREFDKLIKKQ
jgi:hypothetical protein